ncbi:hypothetical protein [Parasulfitobacter algicola]|uniref:Uncharacterized protein n=1 Tax=Parasulfitobacter algicola TaxID=2614809 RepID=A0ABX2INZ6_9RHOB|nr:hypothetical protein [Sulfitobacter algicola]NSX53696.1 hypothetical protein [Sulfitobacter algicola]
MSLALPAVPLSLQLAVAMPALDPDARLDMQIAAGFEAMRLPNIDFGGGAMAQIAMTLSMMAGTFAIDDLPQLDFQMQQAAESFNRNVWPRLGWLTTLKIQPLLNFAIIARLVLDLRSLGIDPFAIESLAPPPARIRHNFRFALSPPKLRMARILAGLPQLINLPLALNIPALGDPGAMSAMNNRLNGFARLTPPKLIVSMPMLTKLAMVLESLATIEEAFGDAFSPAGIERVRSMLRLWGGFPIPIPPLPALALNAKLDALPPLEDIRLGEQMAGSMSGTTLNMRFSPPKLAIMPFMNVMLALNASMTMSLDIPPFDMCSMCPCS